MTGEVTVDDLLSGYDDSRWLGFGYLGARRNELSERPERVRLADLIVVKVANEQGWDRETLFHWANSKLGRWFGDAVFGSTEPVTLTWLRSACWSLFAADRAEFMP